MKIEEDFFPCPSHLEQKGVILDKNEVFVSVGNLEADAIKHFLDNAQRFKWWTHYFLQRFDRG
jgi:hypothetical protein